MIDEPVHWTSTSMKANGHAPQASSTCAVATDQHNRRQSIFPQPVAIMRNNILGVWQTTRARFSYVFYFLSAACKSATCGTRIIRGAHKSLSGDLFDNLQPERSSRRRRPRDAITLRMQYIHS